jgi:hydrogenase maturation protease
MKVVIAGVGNMLMGDDGAGAHAANMIRRHSLPDDIRVVDGGTVGIELAAYFDDAEKVIFMDAIRLDAPVGTIVRFTGDEIPADHGSAGSAHGSSLAEVISFCRSFLTPLHIVVYCVVVPDTQQTSLRLSKGVSDVLPALVQAVLHEALAE